MRKKIKFILPLFFFLPGLLFAQEGGALEDALGDVPGQSSIELITGTSWEAFSKGLYYKNRGIDEKDASKRIQYLKTGADYLFYSLKKGGDKGRIYYHLAETYYYLQSIDKALLYGQKSVEKLPRWDKPYFIQYAIYMRLKNYKKAAGVLESYTDKVPDNVAANFTLARIYYQSIKNYTLAARKFRLVLEIAETVPTADFYKRKSLYYLGYIYYLKKNKDLAVTYMKRLLTYDIHNKQVLNLLTRISMEYYKIDDAIYYGEKFLQHGGDNVVINAIMGRCYYLKNDDRALYYLRKASISKTVAGVLSKGLLFQLLGKNGEAEKMLQAVKNRDEKILSTYIGLARIYRAQGENEESYKYYAYAGVMANEAELNELALELLLKDYDPSKKNASVEYYIARSYESLEQYNLALIHYQRTYKIKENRDILIHIGYVYSFLKDYTMSLKYINHVIEKDENNHRAHFFKGMVFLKKSDYVNSQKSIEKAISLKQDNEVYYFYLASVLEKRDKIKETVEALEKAVSVDSKSARAYNFLGYLYAKQNKNLVKSKELIEKALDLDPENGAYLDSLGWVEYRLGKYSKALRYLLRAEEILRIEGYKDPEVYDHIGDTYHKLGKDEEAVKFWHKSYKIKKNKHVNEKIQRYTNS